MARNKRIAGVALLVATSHLALAASKTAEQKQTDLAVAEATAKALGISAGGRHSCVIHDAALECWGDEEFQNNGRREGKFAAVTCGSWHTCALDAATHRAKCFGAGYALQAEVPAIPFKAISAGFADTCGISEHDGSLICWGVKSDKELKPPLGKFAHVSVGTRSACAVSSVDGSVQCWGSDEFQQMSGAPQTTGLRTVSVGGGHTCALTQGGRISCWGGSDNYRLGRSIPATKVAHAQVVSGEDHACALGQDGAIRCWGHCSTGACDPPPTTSGKPHEYVAVAAGGLRTCGVRKADSVIDCWGDVPEQAPGKPAWPPLPITKGSAKIEIDARAASVASGIGGMLSRFFGSAAGSSNSSEL